MLTMIAIPPFQVTDSILDLVGETAGSQGGPRIKMQNMEEVRMAIILRVVIILNNLVSLVILNVLIIVTFCDIVAVAHAFGAFSSTFMFDNKMFKMFSFSRCSPTWTPTRTGW